MLTTDAATVSGEFCVLDGVRVPSSSLSPSGFGNHRGLLGDPGASVVTVDDVSVAPGAVGASRYVLRLAEINNVVRCAGHKSQRGGMKGVAKCRVKSYTRMHSR